jgi:hypothetical protein
MFVFQIQVEFEFSIQFECQIVSMSSMKIHLVFQVYLLEPYHTSTIPGRIHDPPPPIKIDGEHEYEVENIFNSRISNCQF